MTKVLIAVGGISGLATALVLARHGLDVDLVERTDRVDALGSGIALIGPALRALDDLGIVEEYVVESSVQLSAWQILPVTPDKEQRQLFGEAVGVLAEP